MKKVFKIGFTIFDVNARDMSKVTRRILLSNNLETKKIYAVTSHLYECRDRAEMTTKDRVSLFSQGGEVV